LPHIHERLDIDRLVPIRRRGFEVVRLDHDIVDTGRPASSARISLALARALHVCCAHRPTRARLKVGRHTSTPTNGLHTEALGYFGRCTMNQHRRLTRKNFHHKVAGAFDHPVLAKVAAGKVQESLRLSSRQFRVLKPEEFQFEPVLEPESEGIVRAAVRSHTGLGLLGAASGAFAFAMLLAYGNSMIHSSPGLSAAVLIGIGTLGGMLLGSLLTQRAEQGPDLHGVADALRQGRSVVVVHSRDAQECSAVQRELQRLGALTIRTL
jgi:hypothetical protein